MRELIALARALDHVRERSRCFTGRVAFPTRNEPGYPAARRSGECKKAGGMAGEGVE